MLVENHQTIVLGGIYDQNQSELVTKTPFLGDLPLIGHAFKQKQHITHRSELLIFITPKIMPYQIEKWYEIKRLLKMGLIYSIIIDTIN